MSDTENKQDAEPKDEIRIEAGFEDGNVTLMGDDGVEFRIPDYHLMARSEVFRSMFTAVQSDEKIVRILHATRNELAIWVASFLDVPPPKFQWTTCEKVLELCHIYDAPHVAKLVLRAYTDHIEPLRFKDALVAAAKLDDVESAFLILHQCHRQGSHRHEVIDLTIDFPDLAPPHTWAKELAGNFSGTWMWGFYQAMNDCVHLADRGPWHDQDRPVSADQGADYWRSFACAFRDRMKE